MMFIYSSLCFYFIIFVKYLFSFSFFYANKIGYDDDFDDDDLINLFILFFLNSIIFYYYSIINSKQKMRGERIRR